MAVLSYPVIFLSGLVLSCSVLSYGGSCTDYLLYRLLGPPAYSLVSLIHVGLWCLGGRYMYNMKKYFWYCVLGSYSIVLFPLEAANTCNLGIYCRELVYTLVNNSSLQHYVKR